MTRNSIEKLTCWILGILSILYIVSVVTRTEYSRVNVLLADDWVLLRTAALNMDSTLLNTDQMTTDSGNYGKIIQTNKSGAYVVQDGWRLTLHLRPKINQILNIKEDLVVHLIPFKSNNKVKWACIHKGSDVSSFTPPYKTTVAKSNLDTSILPWNCK